MRHRPLNSLTPFELWPPFDPGRFIDFNPSFVRLASGRAFAVIRRDRVPPVPGKGTVWAVAVDDAMRPTGRPFPLVADGEDPRAVAIGERVLVFYVLFERDGEGRITGTSMVLAEFDAGPGADADTWVPLAHFKLPKTPLGGAPAGSHAGWEKNWVPFVISPTQVGLIYSHDPWQVIVLNVDAASRDRRFEQAYRAEGLQWNFGGIRGGTPPVAYRQSDGPWDGAKEGATNGANDGANGGGAGELITFFHSSEVVGSRKSYMAGACIFASQPPYHPLRMTLQPLLVAPYRGGMHRHGWAVAASVIFPLGCDRAGGGWRLLCGIDDGEIGSFTVPDAALHGRLSPLPAAPAATVASTTGNTLRADAPLLLQPPGAPPFDLPLLRFLALAADSGRTLLDVGGDAGLFMAGLAAGYRHVEAVATSAPAAHWRARTVALNGLAHASVHLPKGLPAAAQDLSGLAASFARPPWTLTTLDDAGFINVDLLTVATVDVTAVLHGLRHTIARDRPLMLLLPEPGPGLGDGNGNGLGGTQQERLGALLHPLGYTVQAIFPRSPGALLCVHAAGRDKIAWFI